MSSYLDYDNPINVIFRSEPFPYVEELNTVVNGKIVLLEIPDSLQHVIIDSYSEVYNTSDIVAGTFLVDYATGWMYFDSSENGNQLTCKYYKKAVILFPSSRVFLQGSLDPYDLQEYLELLVTAESNAEIGVYSLDATGTNTLTATYTGLTYFEGLKVNLTIANKNTGAVTLNINSIGAKDIKYIDSQGTKQDIPANSFYAGNIYTLEYDGTDFIIINAEMAPDYSTPTTETAPIISLPAATKNGQFVGTELQGNTKTNVAEDAWATDLTGWTSAEDSIDAATYYKLTKATDTTGERDISSILDVTKNYLVTVYGVNASDTLGAKFDIIDGSGGVSIEASTTLTATQSARIGLILQASDLTGTTPYLQMTHIGSGYAKFYQFFIQEISSAEYAEGLTILMARYPYRPEGTKHTQLHRLRSVGKNLFDKTAATEQYRVSETTGDLISDTLYRASDFIGVQEGVSYKQNTSSNLRYAFYDDNKNFLSGGFGNLYTASQNGYLRFSSFSSIDNIQLEEGSSATTYEAYKKSETYLPAILRSVPAAQDEVDLDTGVKTQRVSDEHTLDTAQLLLGTGTNLDYVYYPVSLLVGCAATTTTNSGIIDVHGMVQGSYTGYDAVANVGKFITDVTNLYFLITKGTSLADAKTALTGTIITYQLATPLTTILEGVTAPSCFEDGTLYVEYAIKDTAFYASGITIADSDYPIDSLEAVWLVVGDIKTPVALSTATVAGDGLSFTLSGASNGEKYEYVYLYSTELSTIPSVYYSVPVNLSAQIDSNSDAIVQIKSQLGDIWETLLILADRELAMVGVAVIATDMSADANDDELKSKINEILAIWV